MGYGLQSPEEAANGFLEALKSLASKAPYIRRAGRPQTSGTPDAPFQPAMRISLHPAFCVYA